MSDNDTAQAVREPGRRPRSRFGNRALLAGGLAAAGSAVLCLGLIQSAASGTTAAPAPAAAQQAAQPVAAAQQPAAAADYKVDIKDMKFGSAKLTVHVGDTVQWTNSDEAPHTVTTTKGPKKFDSGTLNKGDSWSYTFTTPGTYEYYCAVHPDMTASITVLADDGGSDGGGTSGGGTGGGGTSGGGTSGGGTSGGGTSGGGTGDGGTGGTGGGHSGGTGGGHNGGTSGGGTPGGGTGGGDSSGDGSGGDGSECADVRKVLMPILHHLKSAHLERSPGEQVQDALELDQYIKTHTVWVESILDPAVEDGGATVDKTLSVILQHVKVAHLEESPGQQIQDALNLDSYVKMHTVWAEHLLQPTEDYLTGSC
ncbi:cupredoxin family copper-binding protein [Streptomyces sp. NPDC019937]|uniref:cupredoxin domain-containing protein n=1 Tax=Streptomyces sp. NPDC019937 TaxID=3154787 RepID=UPI0033DDA032